MLSMFLQTQCRMGKAHSVRDKDLFEAYEAWACSEAIVAADHKSWRLALAARGFAYDTTRQGDTWRGLALKPHGQAA